MVTEHRRGSKKSKLWSRRIPKGKIIPERQTSTQYVRYTYLVHHNCCLWHIVHLKARKNEIIPQGEGNRKRKWRKEGRKRKKGQKEESDDQRTEQTENQKPGPKKKDKSKQAMSINKELYLFPRAFKMSEKIKGAKELLVRSRNKREKTREK